MTHSPSMTILITGCSSGFGLLAAARLASRGHRVIATMRDLEKQGPLCDELESRNARADIFEMDVTDVASVDRAVSEIGAKYGSLDVLINNAGMAVGGAFEDLTQAEIRWVMETNFFGVQNVTRAVIPLMRPQRAGRIINLSSVSGFYGAPGLGAYNASKWALEGFSESLAHELSFFGIHVILIEPASYKTKIFKENIHLAGNFSNPRSPYFAISRHLKECVDAQLADNHRNPEDVVRVIEHAVVARNPKFRYQTEIEGKTMYLLKRFLPTRMVTWLIRRSVFHGFSPEA